MAIERQELTPGQQESVRRAHIAALAIAFGAGEQQAFLMASELMADSGRFSRLNHEIDGWDQKPQNLARIERLGSQFITNKDYESLKYTVGARVLGLLREDVHTGTFTNLWDWINMWTKSDSTAVYKKALRKLTRQPASS